ncbi:AfsR/SARP family transcriptional regulator [Kibdelosporangium aridum]|uniref:AfsR/SARP family transcriptional regulator n=1 Tax=Kibdelosporangium aridum TaxID=2030 RepID=UPI0035E8FC00
MRFGVLGPLAVWTSTGVPVQVAGTKLRSLLAALLVHEGRFVSTDRLIEDLWGDDLPGNPLATLQNKVWQLRRALDNAEPGAGSMVVHQQAGYVLRTEPGAVDADRFTTLTSQARAATDPRTQAALFAEAMALWRGEPYIDFADLEFTRPAIALLNEQRIRAIEDHAEALHELGEHAQLVEQLTDVVAQHPLRERLQATYLLALYRAGRQGEALHWYTQLQERLRSELGTGPGKELVELHLAMLDQNPALDPRSRASEHRRSADQPARTAHRADRPGRGHQGGVLVVADRARRHSHRHRWCRQDEAGARHGRALAGFLPGRNVPRLAGTPGARRGSGRRGRGGGRDAGRPGRDRLWRGACPSPHRLPTGWWRCCAPSECCWCSTTASTSSRPPPS